jgi:hypothetical protein
LLRTFIPDYICTHRQTTITYHLVGVVRTRWRVPGCSRWRDTPTRIIYMITIFPNVYKVEEPSLISIEQFVSLIKKGDPLIQQLRNTASKPERDAIKQQLPVICLAGEFLKRNKTSCAKHSGLMPLDFDGLDKASVITLSPYIYMAWVSPSGNGTRAVVKIPPVIENHEGYFRAIKTHFNNPCFDDNVGHVAGGSYLSYDPDIYINENAPIWDQVEQPRQYAPQTTYVSHNDQLDKTFTYINKWLDGKGEHFVNGNRNHYIHTLASACCRAGVDINDTISYCLDKSCEDFNEKEIKASVRSAYRTSQFGSWDINEVTSRVTSQVTARPTSRAVTRTTTPSADEPYIFWSMQKDKPYINRSQFVEWLTMNGIRHLRINKDGGTTLIQINKNIVRKVDKIYICKLITDYLLEHSSELFYETFIRGVDAYLSTGTLQFLPTADVEWNRDTKDCSWVYFKNTAVKVTCSDPELYDYDSLPGCIWDTEILDRDYSYVHDTDTLLNCVFGRFLGCVSGINESAQESGLRHAAMMSIIGYLIHSYKDPTKPNAIVFTDEVISENPQGGTGKGIFIKAITHFRKHHYIDGKSFTFDRSFLWMGIDLDTKIVFMDDVRKNFDFERLFSVITEGITVENKGKNTFHIPFANSPKFVITANSALKGEGNSHERRKIEIEFTNFFNKDNNPERFFGHQLYDGWDKNEWTLFDNFMLLCSQLYFKDGLMTPKSKNIEIKKLTANTSSEFLEWAEDRLFEGMKSTRRDLYDNFISFFPEQKRYVSTHRFNAFLESYFTHHRIPFDVKKSNNTWFLTTYSKQS